MTYTPWTRGNHPADKSLAICEGPHIIARVIGTGYPTGTGWSLESDARARLIAAAPALRDALDALLRLVPVANRPACDPDWHVIHAACAALALAAPDDAATTARKIAC